MSFSPVEGDINKLIDEVYKKKYRESPYWSPMISKHTRAATINIILK
ncbi:DUF2255 family protein [Niastella vici]